MGIAREVIAPSLAPSKPSDRVTESIKRFDAEISRLSESLPDYALFADLPGAGPTRPAAAATKPPCVLWPSNGSASSSAAGKTASLTTNHATSPLSESMAKAG
ncbi:MAG TPA: hypothetical protein VHB79_02945 [Polyangiaceae bacterium]|nr:hypothetical protein [Polyangiaceae bacterium]